MPRKKKSQVEINAEKANIARFAIVDICLDERDPLYHETAQARWAVAFLADKLEGRYKHERNS